MKDGKPSGNMFAAGEIMAGNVLGKGYLAGIGMTIGAVFGRIAGEGGGACSATDNLREADRLMTICNACRYCEGLCAVFPAMEMRRTFADADLNYLANLCHRLRRLLFRLPVFAAARVQRQRAGGLRQSCATIATPPTPGRAVLPAPSPATACSSPRLRREHGRFHHRLCRLRRSGARCGRATPATSTK